MKLNERLIKIHVFNTNKEHEWNIVFQNVLNSTNETSFSKLI